MTLREALREALEARGESVLAFCRREGWTPGIYTAVNRWLRTQRDPRTGRVFRLPLYLRLKVSRAIAFDGRLLTDDELAVLSPSSSGSSSQGREEGRRGRRSEKSKKKSRRARADRTKLT